MQRDCHEVAHHLGRLNAEKRPLSDLAAVVSEASGACQFGYQHGTLMRTVDIPTDAEFVKVTTNACTGFPRQGYTYSSCVHGIGHAAIGRSPQDPARAAELCGELGEDGQWCVSGAIMGWGEQGGASILKKAGMSEATRVCEAVGATRLGANAGAQCARELPHILTAGEHERRAVAAWCESLTGQEMQTNCAVGVGFTFLNDAEPNQQTVLETCTVLSEELAGVCLGSTAGVMYQRWNGERDVSSFCTSATGAVRQSCEAYLQDVKNLSAVTMTS